MDLDTEKYFDELFSTLRSEGWKSILEDMAPKVKSIEEQILSFPLEPAISDFAKGKLSVYKEFQNLETFMTRWYKQLKEDEAEALE